MEHTWHQLTITEDGWVYLVKNDGEEIGLGDIGVDILISDKRKHTLEEMLTLSRPHLREISFHTDGRVIAKTGASAPKPKKLYTARPAEGKAANYGDLAVHAITKLIKDNRV